MKESTRELKDTIRADIGRYTRARGGLVMKASKKHNPIQSLEAERNHLLLKYKNILSSDDLTRSARTMAKAYINEITRKYDEALAYYGKEG